VLTWKCHICGRVREDSLISVLTKPLIMDGETLVDRIYGIAMILMPVETGQRISALSDIKPR